MDLATLVNDFATALKAVDATRPQATSHRSGNAYTPGIGPHSEDAAVRLIVAELKERQPHHYPDLSTGFPYPGTKQKCDLALGKLPEWAIEVKMARLSGDNGKPDDTSLKDILSPYDRDRSAVTDCKKLSSAGFPGRVAILIYGFDDERRELEAIIAAFETLAGSRVKLGFRVAARFEGLVHPVHKSGAVFAWEILR